MERGASSDMSSTARFMSAKYFTKVTNSFDGKTITSSRFEKFGHGCLVSECQRK